MTTQVQHFKDLHTQPEALLIANVWNVQSAKVFAASGISAIATSSAAVAETLGYADGEQMPFEEYFFIIERIKACTDLPFSVDLEGGYARSAAEITHNIQRLAEIGVVGINIEDSVMTNGQRTILDAQVFAALLREIKAGLDQQGIEMFINVRCDAFLLTLPDALNEALSRAGHYVQAGVNGLFLPCITQIDDIKTITASIKLPLNVMCMPALPGFDELNQAGVKRISMGNFLNKKAYQALQQEVSTIVKMRSFGTVFH